ncbi:MAG: DUF1015 domain-containing protein [Bacteroidia bacterium]|nr:DUF1015 domain-containing protein [Bacteroidia bacterium]NNF82771.1 DUF1015 domain-containing protein [Flavobacteriaceae bacterium]NNK70965.1 DUF1015 domain-containing protein [Flavobacteriaceae bacterium]NNL79144.1 DUF1015 domain-containing protein [Flavobacteriaceae bacterium]
MAHIIPFKAVRPTRDKVSLVASRSYQTYTQEERDARLEYNPFTFLHIINPGYKYHKTLKGRERYRMVRNRYSEFKEDHIFIQDKKPAFYVYKIVNRAKQVFNGIVGAVSIDDYKKNIIKKHEDTIEFREQTFKEYLKTVGFNAEPVLLTYPDNDQLKAIIEDVQKDRAEFEFTTTYRDTHYLWIVDDEKAVQTIKDAFESVDTIYIADGHHRSSSSVLLAEDQRASNPEFTGDEGFNFFMSYLLPESDLRIYEFNRLVRDLNNLSKDDFLMALDSCYRVENRGTTVYKPTKKHHFSMYLDGEYYSLYLRKNEYKVKTALDELDTQILHKTILEPILGIKDPRNDTRIDYTHRERGLSHVKSEVDSGEFAVGFGMLPTSIEDLKAIADEGQTMPPKSTFILPKLRSGVTIYEF